MFYISCVSCNGLFFALTNRRHTKHDKIYERISLDGHWFILVMMSGCGSREQASQQVDPVKVKVMTVVSSVRNETVRFSGTVQEENGSALSFPLMGRVKSVQVDLGSRVRQGKLLATLDEASVESTYQAAKAALKQAEDAYRRMKELHEKGVWPT